MANETSPRCTVCGASTDDTITYASDYTVGQTPMEMSVPQSTRTVPACAWHTVGEVRAQVRARRDVELDLVE